MNGINGDDHEYDESIYEDVMMLKDLLHSLHEQEEIESDRSDPQRKWHLVLRN